MTDNTVTADIATAEETTPPSNTTPREQLTRRFQRANRLSVAGILHACQTIIDAKDQLPRGQFTGWVVDDIKLAHDEGAEGGAEEARKKRQKAEDTAMRVAQMHMLVGWNRVLKEANHWFALPASWRTLYELVPIDERRMRQLIADGKIHPGMTREDAIALNRGRAQDSGRFFLSAVIAQLLKQQELLGDAAAVANLRDHPGPTSNPITPADIDGVCRWLKKVAKDWRAAE